jgi:hypothetical protein
MRRVREEEGREAEEVAPDPEGQRRKFRVSATAWACSCQIHQVK